MQQVKIFKGIETDITMLEEEVNSWIRQTGVRVAGMTGNIAPQSGGRQSSAGSLGKSAFAPSDIVLIVMYEMPST